GMLSTRESPPANAVKKKSGKIIPGRNSDGVVNTLCSTRHATANATDQKFRLIMCASTSAGAPSWRAPSTRRRAGRRTRKRAPAPPRAARRGAPPPAGRGGGGGPEGGGGSASQSQPAMIRLRSPSIRYEI